VSWPEFAVLISAPDTDMSSYDRCRGGTGPISRYAARYGIELPAGMIGEFIGPDGEAR